MLDRVVRDVVIVDGTGSPGVSGDVGIRGDEIVAVGSVDESASEVIEGGGRALAPGFIDLHTHYDAQLMWDPFATPSLFHGVTTVIGGNCGFTIAPAAPDHVEYLARMLARVEGMSLESLQTGLDWGWSSFGDWLGRLEGRIAVNAGFLVGHSTLRRLVLGAESVERAATPAEVAAMAALLGRSLAAGGLGFSSSSVPAHRDMDGNPVPSRLADRDEFITLASVVARFAGTTLEYLPGLSEQPFSDEQVAMLADLSATAARPVNWNSLKIEAVKEETCWELLGASDQAAERGARVVALSLPVVSGQRLSFESGYILDMFPGWKEMFALPIPERMQTLRDPQERARLRANAESVAAAHGHRTKWDRYTIVETMTAENRPYEGRVVGEIAGERRADPFDVLIDIVLTDALRTGIMPGLRGNSPEDWALRGRVWQDPRVVLGASDAGAHLDMISSFTYTTDFLGQSVRDRGLMSLEAGVRLITDVPARFYGLRGRGRIAVGHKADLVLFDPSTIGSDTVRMRNDLPANGPRLYAEALGIDTVLVNGEPVVEKGAIVGTTPGVVLRSGVGTETPTLRAS
jgi:N-acyl-D-aspartate/D-glutamate deacylase